MPADPFSDRNALDANPFADPSVQGALRGGSGRAYDGETLHSAKSATFDEEAHIGAGGAAPGDAGRLADIERRERELEQRERDLQSRADHIQKHGRNNWPPFYPLIYHDINAEIPAESQQVVRHLYYLWLIWLFYLTLNMVTCIIRFISGLPDGVKDMISSIIYLPILGVASFLLWYRPAYNGFMKEHSLFYYVYFIFMGFHIAYSAYAFIGIPSTGCVGLISLLQAWNQGKVVAGILSIIVTIAVAFQGLANLWYYREIWKHNHEQGHSFAQARAELATHGAKAYFTRGSQV